MAKRLEKWEIFNFADFHLKSHISLIYELTMEIIICIAFDICTTIKVQYKNAYIYYLVSFQCLSISKLLPLPPSKLNKILENYIYFLKRIELKGQQCIYFTVSIHLYHIHSIKTLFEVISMQLFIKKREKLVIYHFKISIKFSILQLLCNGKGN